MAAQVCRAYGKRYSEREEREPKPLLSMTLDGNYCAPTFLAGNQAFETFKGKQAGRMGGRLRSSGTIPRPIGGILEGRGARIWSVASRSLWKVGRAGTGCEPNP